MGIKVWIMKGEVYGKRSFPLAGMDKKTSWRKRWRFSSWKSTLIKVENQTLVKESNF
jgi:ribosomal protein S3